MFDLLDFLYLDSGDGGGLDLDKLEEDDGQEEDAEEKAKEDEGDGPSQEDVDKWLRKNGYTAYSVNDPILKKLYDDNHKDKAKEEEQDDKDLEDLLVKDPKKYAAEVAKRSSEATRREMGEATKLQNQILRELQKEVPELDQEDFDRISEDVAGASLVQLRDWKQRGSVLTAGKAAVFDRNKKGGAKRSANTNTDRTTTGGGSGSTVPVGLQPKLSQMAEALRQNGFDVKDEDIAGSSYAPKRGAKK